MSFLSVQRAVDARMPASAPMLLSSRQLAADDPRLYVCLTCPQVLERHLVSLGGLGHPGGIVLEVVTGLGRHSSAGQPRLLPAVVRFLSDAGYRFDTQEGNSGLINVFIGC